jgi:hypothetical protein
MPRTHHVRRLVVVGLAIALPTCALAAVAVDTGGQRASDVSASAVDPAAFPLAENQPLFSGAGASNERTSSARQEADGQLQQRVVIAVNDSTSSTSSTEPPPTTATPSTIAPEPTTTVQVLGGSLAPPAPAVAGPTDYTG